jgi:hypothetical protein
MRGREVEEGWGRVLRAAGARIKGRRDWLNGRGEPLGAIQCIILHWNCYDDAETVSRCARAARLGFPIVSCAWAVESLIHQRALPHEDFLLDPREEAARAASGGRVRFIGLPIDRPPPCGDASKKPVVSSGADRATAPGRRFRRLLLDQGSRGVHPFDVGEFATLVDPSEPDEEVALVKILEMRGTDRTTALGPAGRAETSDACTVKYLHLTRACPDGDGSGAALQASHEDECPATWLGHKIVVLPRRAHEARCWGGSEGPSSCVFFWDDYARDDGDDAADAEASDDGWDDDPGDPESGGADGGFNFSQDY